MKRKMIFSVLVVACISLSACGNNSTEKTSSEVTVEETSEVITNEAGEVYEENSDRLDNISKGDFKKKYQVKKIFGFM